MHVRPPQPAGVPPAADTEYVACRHPSCATEGSHLLLQWTDTVVGLARGPRRHMLTRSKGGQHWVWNRERLFPHKAMRPAQAVRTLFVGRGVFQAHLGGWEQVRKLHSIAFPTPPSPAPFLLKLHDSVGDFRRCDKVMWHSFLHNDVFWSFSSEWNVVSFFQEFLLEDYHMTSYLSWYPKAPTQNSVSQKRALF